MAVDLCLCQEYSDRAYILPPAGDCGNRCICCCLQLFRCLAEDRVWSAAGSCSVNAGELSK